MSRSGESLREYTELYQAGASPEVVWDLRGCLPKRMNMATLAAFLSIADRLREFSGKPQRARVHYDPEVLAFWDDIHFKSLAEDFDLFDWEPKEVMGGYSRGLTNPNTRIFAFTVSDDPPPRCNETAWIAWKDKVRDRVRDKLMLLCGPLFVAKARTNPFPQELVNLVANTCAELVLNSSLWGKSIAFVALQRSSKGITAAVCDTGKGLHASLSSPRDKLASKEPPHPKPANDLESIVLASLVNQKDFGLRKAISQVLDRNGWVLISSVSGLVEWRKESWLRATNSFKKPSDAVPPCEKLFPSVSPASTEAKAGHFRTFDYGVRGVRISFEIPIISQESR